MKWLSLFSGVGGFDLALQNLGEEVIGACEIDDFARSVYAKRFPGTKIYKDATKIDAEQLPDFDGIVAGFPCQTFSIAGNRLGFEESRGTLFFEIVRIARQKRPRYLLLENVKGLLSHDNGRTFAIILSTLDELGYDAEWQVCNSKYFVPQNRERIFIIAYLRGEPRPKVFPIREVDQLSATEKRGKRKKGEGIRSEDIASTVGSRYGSLQNSGETYLKQVGNIDRSGHNSLWGRVYDPNRTDVIGKINDSQSGIVYSVGGLAPNLNANGGGMGAKTGLFAVAWSKSHRTGNGKYDKNRHNYGKVEERIKIGEFNTLNTGDGCRTQSSANYVVDKPIFTQYTDHAGSRVYDPKGPSSSLMADNGTGSRLKIEDGTRIRKLTPLECERLQGFPDGWTEGLSDTQRYKCMGNAVTVPLVQFILSKLL